MKNIILSAIILGFSAIAGAQPAPTPASNSEYLGPRLGLGQPSSAEPARLENLKLNDPLVQRKFLNDPDLLRFLKGTYSEMCARGYLGEALKTIKASNDGKISPDQKAFSARLLDSGKIWKMPSLEMEAVFGKAYMKVSNYCDCVVQELPTQELVNPRTGTETLKNVSSTVKQSCEAIADEKTARQLQWKEKEGRKGSSQ